MPLQLSRGDTTRLPATNTSQGCGNRLYYATFYGFTTQSGLFTRNLWAADKMNIGPRPGHGRL